MNFNRVLQGIPSPLVPRLKDQREFSSMVSLSLSYSLFLSSSLLFPLPIFTLPLFSFWTPFSNPFLPLGLLSLSYNPFLRLTLLVAFSLSLSLSTLSPCEICIRATRGVIIAKPLSVPWHREQLMTLSTKTCYWRTKCCDELLKSCTMADKMFG